MAEKEASSVILNSEITCPECGFAKVEKMPVDACQFFYQCTNCEVILRPKEGDCCAFCSYGSEVCPPRQSEPNKSCC